MSRLILIAILWFNLLGSSLSAQNLQMLFPAVYPKEAAYSYDDSLGNLYPDHNVRISKSNEIIVGDEVVHKLMFHKYYDYIVEIFSSDRSYILVSPMKFPKGMATPYSVDRGIMFIIDYSKSKKYYCSMDLVKQICDEKTFETFREHSDMVRIKMIDTDNKKIVFLKGGPELTEITEDLYDF